MKVFWTAEAEESFSQNITYLEENWNEEVIGKFIGKTEEAISTITKHPTLYPIINKQKGIHKCLVVKQIALYYRVHNNRIDLLTFWNTFQNPKRLKF
ncbi:MAG TPA: hypothetical protein VK154_16020 [Chitinophagales bacterium]|nr:hypothetical protein [Chitinophagales bacterium]